MVRMTWTVPAPEPVDGPLSGDDRAILEGYLAWQRSTLLHICAGLTAEQLAERPAPPSTLSLLGLIRHLAKVERIWLRQRVAGQTIPALYGGAGDDTDFTATNADDAEQEIARLRDEWQQADQAVARVPFDYEVQVHGEAMSLRMVYVHLIGEYARHNGHADLLRESIDGETGE